MVIKVEIWTLKPNHPGLRASSTTHSRAVPLGIRPTVSLGVLICKLQRTGVWWDLRKVRAAAATAGSSARREALAAHLSPREGTQQMESTREGGASPPKDGPPATHRRPGLGRQGGKKVKMGEEKIGRAEAGVSSAPRPSAAGSPEAVTPSHDPPEHRRIPAWDIQVCAAE